ncbi:unnamed protein product [Trichobilharzia szidati]|nr:unnamed protein product [Trichobilharzia szidati]
MYRQDRSSSGKKRGGGVATFINSQWSVANNVCFKFSNDNIDCITVKCRPKHLSKYKFIYITNIYVTPCCSNSELSMLADEFTIFAAAPFGNSLSIVTGDFNSCDCSFLTVIGHENVVNFPTRLDNSLDLVFINDFGIYEARKRAPLFNSDHCIVRVLPKIFGKLHKRTFSHLSKKTVHGCYSMENVHNLRSMLKDTKWDLFKEDSLDDTISNITSYLKFCLDTCCPRETLFIRFDRFSSPQLKKLSRQKEKLYKMKDNAGLKRINILIKSEMHRLNSIHNQKFISCKNASNIWKLFKEITGGKQMNSIPFPLDVSELNKSFIHSPTNAKLSSVTSINETCFPGFTTNDVLKCLQSMNPSCSLGPDGLPSVILKNCADILCYPLMDIFNESFSKNVVPAAWKDIKIVRIPKSSTATCFKFRPIAITSPFLKAVEKLLLLNLQPSLKAFNNPKQFPYKHSRRTLDAAAVLYHNIVSSLDKRGKFVRCTFLDYTSAFDSVPRDILLNKLAETQTDCWVVKWLHSYFSERKQYTVCQGKSSTSLLTEAGVPQGAVLSPFLFSFFLHDLPHSDEMNFVKDADDLTISVSVNSQLDCIKINHFLSEISKWSSSNGLKLNPSKCQTVNFSFRCKRKLNEAVGSYDPCKIDDTDVEAEYEVKYLGLVLSSALPGLLMS